MNDITPRETTGPQTTAHEGTAHEGTAHESTAHESTAHESTAHESTAHESTAHESTAHESTAHESTAHESTAHESTAHESTAHESTAHESTAHESTAHESTAHESTAHESTAHESTAHESTAHESTAHESTAHESTAHESTAHESTAHESTAHESTAHESTAHESTAHESTAHESTAHESTAHESTAHESTAHPIDLQAAAKQTMLAHGLEPEFPPAVQQQLAELKIHPPQVAASPNIRDLRDLLWSSIDNDTSKDLDQIEVAERLPNGETKVLVGIADVDVFVPRGSAIDQHAAKETTTVYTGVRNFSMLPEQLSTDESSLGEAVDRLSVVTEFVVGSDGTVHSGNVYRAIVRNKAQLTYNAVGAWLENRGAVPDKVAASTELQSQLKMQDEAAQKLMNARYRNGALNIETIEISPILSNGKISGLVRQQKNRATELIEDFMIAANEVVARMLEDNKVSSIRRVVKTPERWDRIVELAAQHGGKLPAQADSKALNDFLIKRKAADPDHFVDVSLAVIKLMGPGEYVLERPGDPEQGHFGLAVQDYTHSTAPNRRFADLVTQRLIKAVLAKSPAPYSDDELASIARNCTLKEDAARKVEREMSKRIAAVAMSGKIGQVFDAIVTGVTPQGTFVRALEPAVEGLLAQGQRGVDVGDRLTVKLISTDIQKGYIDFARV